MPVIKVIETHRLALRPIQVADARWITAGVHWPEVYRMVASIAPEQTLNETQAWIAWVAAGRSADTNHVYAIWYERVPLGIIGADRQDCCEVFGFGYWIDPQAWGQGFATEAAHALMVWLRGVRNVQALKNGLFRG